MESQVRTWLYDILNSINEIESYFEDQPKLFKKYKAHMPRLKIEIEGLLKK